MSSEKIYFCGSIRAGRDDQPIYAALAEHLTSNYGPVLTQHVASVVQHCDVGATEQEIHDRDVAWLHECTSVVAECTVPSLGVGYELGLAAVLKKPTLILFRKADAARSLSAMIRGQKDFTTVDYTTIDEAKKAIDSFYAKLHSK